MKKLFTHENRMIIFNLKNVLREEGIDCFVKNEFASSAVGELATFDTWPELWVCDASQFDSANSTLHKIVYNKAEKSWFCRACQEKNDEAFRLCWNCGHAYE